MVWRRRKKEERKREKEEERKKKKTEPSRKVSKLLHAEIWGFPGSFRLRILFDSVESVTLLASVKAER